MVRNPVLPRFVRLSSYKPHAHAVFWSQGDKWLQAEFLFRHHFQLPLLRKGSEKQDTFGPRKAFADAPPHTTAEREVDILLTGFFDALRGPSFGNKSIGVVPKTRIATGYVWTDENKRALWNDVP